MIERFVKIWDERKHEIELQFREEHPSSYLALVTMVIKLLDNDDYECPDSSSITQLDHGNYQGTLLYIMPARGYQPSTYYCVKVGYGSCSGCDTLQRIRQYEDGQPDDEQVKEYMLLALHIIQGIKEI